MCDWARGVRGSVNGHRSVFAWLYLSVEQMIILHWEYSVELN